MIIKKEILFTKGYAPKPSSLFDMDQATLIAKAVLASLNPERALILHPKVGLSKQVVVVCSDAYTDNLQPARLFVPNNRYGHETVISIRSFQHGSFC